VFDQPLIQRCQQHKIRNVIDKLPDRLKQVTERRMRQAYHAESALTAESELEQLARELDKTHPGTAASLREGMTETLTILRLGVPPTLARTLRSTNPVESMIEICRGTLQERQAVAGRHHDAALVRGRDARSWPPVPPRQRSPAPAQAPRRAGGPLHQECHRRKPE
jgi:transposase-like protein